jgi:hypothetical protein
LEVELIFDFRKEAMKQRYSPRTATECSISFTGDGVVGEGRVLNLSVPGCLIETSTSLKLGQYLRLHLSFSNGYPSLRIALAAVRRIQGMKVGIEMIRMSAEDAYRLRSLVGYHEPQRKHSAVWSDGVVLSGGETW